MDDPQSSRSNPYSREQMDIVVLPAGGGKTPRLLDWVRSAPDDEIRVAVFHSDKEAHRQMRAAYDREEIPSVFETWQFVSIDEVTHADSGFMWGVKLRRKHIVFGLDNLDLMLSSFIRWPIGMVTMTGGE